MIGFHGNNGVRVLLPVAVRELEPGFIFVITKATVSAFYLSFNVKEQ